MKAILSEAKKDMTYDYGVHDISNADYHNSSAISRSSLMLMLKSAYHYKNKDMVEFKESKSMRIGSMVHTLMMEPHLFDDEYVIQPEFNKRTKAGKEDFALWSETVKGKVISTIEEMETVRLMHSSLNGNKQIAQLFKDADIEKSIFWQDIETGLALKARPDAWKGNLVIDLKTTKDASMRKFMYSCIDYGYFLQAAMIRESLRSIGQELEQYVIVCVENTAPYAHAIYVVDEVAMDWGYNQFRYCLNKLSDCMMAGVWPSYDTQMISVPEYLRKSEDE